MRGTHARATPRRRLADSLAIALPFPVRLLSHPVNTVLLRAKPKTPEL